MDIRKLRNIGISAHIDSGKTTLSERILFYTGRIHRMAEVHGDGGGATMDHMDLEKERGITITSAATSVEWNGHRVNLIDTPGHVDFTVEVERSLRVLDGAVLVLCAVGGVQSQSMTVDRQMKRYHVPRLAFINKMDRAGADPLHVCRQMQDKLDCVTILMQLPIGTGESFVGVIDLVAQQAVYFEGEDGEDVRRAEIPDEYRAESNQARAQLLEQLAMYSDQLMEMLLCDEEVPDDLVHSVLHEAVLQQEATPVFLGTAYRNKGVQPLLDAIIRYLPSPADREIRAQGHGEVADQVRLNPVKDKPFVGMAFKIVDDPYGQLTFIRIYQGTIEKGQLYFNQRTGRKDRFSRIVRMHADKREEIDSASAGDIIAIIGVDCASGDTYSSEAKFCTLESIFVPDPVIQIAVSSLSRNDGDKLAKALQRFRREDPTFRVSTDPETNEMLIAGMGELHLEIYVERIRREYRVAVEVGPPKVSYREAPQRPAEFDYKHRKQTGGSGQYAHIVGRMEPLPAGSEEPFEFEDQVVGGRIPKQFISSIERGFREALTKGPLAEYPVVLMKMILEDGSHHEVDSSDRAFQTCAFRCLRETFRKARPALLEPIMNVEIECPGSFQGAIVGDIHARRGVVTSTEVREGSARIVSEIPLAETFGYATDLRSMTQGLGVFSMELACYRKVPVSIQDEIVAERRQSRLVGSR